MSIPALGLKFLKSLPGGHPFAEVINSLFFTLWFNPMALRRNASLTTLSPYGENFFAIFPHPSAGLLFNGPARSN